MSGDNVFVSCMLLLSTLTLSACLGASIPTSSSDGSDGSTNSGGTTEGSGSTSAGDSSSTGTTGGTSGGSVLRVGEWNIDFFGKADAGPTDDALQATNVTAGVSQVAPDIMAFEEVCDTTYFSQVVTNLQAQYGMTFDAVVANDPSLGNAYSNYGGSWGQKTALIWKPSVATRVAAQLIFREDIDASWGSTFSSRDPLEVKLQLKDGQLLYVIVVHLKAEADVNSYNQRVQASADLQAYLASEHANDAVMVVGDWNDDLDSSIVSGRTSPFTNLLSASNSFEFATKPLSDAHESTTDDHSGHPIDHHLIDAQLFGNLVPGSAQIIQPSIANYAQTTSDHYPTLVQYRSP